MMNSSQNNHLWVVQDHQVSKPQWLNLLLLCLMNSSGIEHSYLHLYYSVMLPIKDYSHLCTYNHESCSRIQILVITWQEDNLLPQTYLCLKLDIQLLEIAFFFFVLKPDVLTEVYPCRFLIMLTKASYTNWCSILTPLPFILLWSHFTTVSNDNVVQFDQWEICSYQAKKWLAPDIWMHSCLLKYFSILLQGDHFKFKASNCGPGIWLS